MEEGFFGCQDKKLERHQVACKRHSLAGRGQGETSSLVELHVSNTAHGLDLGLEGGEVVVVSVVTALKQVLVASVAGVLVTHPTERHKEGEDSQSWVSAFHLFSNFCVMVYIL